MSNLNFNPLLHSYNLIPIFYDFSQLEIKINRQKFL